MRQIRMDVIGESGSSVLTFDALDSSGPEEVRRLFLNREEMIALSQVLHSIATANPHRPSLSDYNQAKISMIIDADSTPSPEKYQGPPSNSA